MFGYDIFKLHVLSVISNVSNVHMYIQYMYM